MMVPCCGVEAKPLVVTVENSEFLGVEAKPLVVTVENSEFLTSTIGGMYGRKVWQSNVMVIGLLVGSSAVIVIVEWDEMWEMG